MSARARRRRAFVLLALALACGGLAASEVGGRVRSAERRIGPAIPVVVAARDLEPGAELARGDLAVRRVPSHYAPRDAPAAPEQAVGLRTAGPVAAGSPITAGVVGGGPDGAPGTLRRGERALTIAVSGGAALTEGAVPGSRVDVIVSTEPGDGAGRSFVALEDAELLALGPAGDGGALGAETDAAAGGPSALATLRVTLRQAVYLTAAQSFARELRLLPRPAGDRRHFGRSTVAAEDL